MAQFPVGRDCISCLCTTPYSLLNLPAHRLRFLVIAEDDARMTRIRLGGFVIPRVSHRPNLFCTTKYQHAQKKCYLNAGRNVEMKYIGASDHGCRSEVTINILGKFIVHFSPPRRSYAIAKYTDYARLSPVPHLLA